MFLPLLFILFLHTGLTIKDEISETTVRNLLSYLKTCFFSSVVNPVYSLSFMQAVLVMELIELESNIGLNMYWGVNRGSYWEYVPSPKFLGEFPPPPRILGIQISPFRNLISILHVHDYHLEENEKLFFWRFAQARR